MKNIKEYTDIFFNEKALLKNLKVLVFFYNFQKLTLSLFIIDVS